MEKKIITSLIYCSPRSLGFCPNIPISDLYGRFTFERICYSKEQIFFTKERRTIRQKSGRLNHSNKRIVQVNIQMQGWINDCWKGAHTYKGMGFALLIVSHLS